MSEVSEDQRSSVLIGGIKRYLSRSVVIGGASRRLVDLGGAQWSMVKLRTLPANNTYMRHGISFPTTMTDIWFMSQIQCFYILQDIFHPIKKKIGPLNLWFNS